MDQETHYSTDKYIHAPRETVFHLLNTLEGIASWWENPVSGDPSQGGQLRFEFATCDGAIDMVVDHSVPSVTEWTVVKDGVYNKEWEGSKIFFRAEEVDSDKTILHFKHFGLMHELTSYDECSKDWGQYLSTIAAVAEGERQPVR